MPAVNVGVTNFEIPENAVRVLLTGYGVSPAVIESTRCFVALITVSSAHLPVPSEPIMARCRPVEQRYPPSRHGRSPLPRSNGDRR